ncbi:MAG: HAD-IA family hydrolase [Patescibacteria group bacterium]
MKSLIFDFDGVIGDTFEVSAQFLVKHSRFSLDRAKELLIKDGLKNKKDSFFYRYVKSWYYRKLLKQFRESKADLIFADKFQELIEKWSDSPKAILTRSDSRVCRALLGERQKHFEFILGRDIVNSKQKGFETISLSSRFKPENCIFITDSVGDYEELSRASVKPAQIYVVSWGFQPKELLLKYIDESIIIDSFQEITSD